MIEEVVNNNTLCFVWQDNKPVIAISFEYNLYRFKDQI
jgi:hypothetical protein